MSVVERGREAGRERDRRKEGRRCFYKNPLFISAAAAEALQIFGLFEL